MLIISTVPVEECVAATELLLLTSKKSHDPDTQTACFIETRNGIVAAEANRIADGVSLDGRTVRPQKYLFIGHAEKRAIAYCARHGIATEGSTMYLKWYPCAPCADAIVTAGIATLVCDREKYEARKDDPRYGFAEAAAILTEGGVKIEWLR